MQTYGRKWRTKSACVNGHVVSRSGAPFMRLNSTGDVTSVDHNSWAAADLGVQPVNNNPCNMKTMANSRVGHWTGLNASNFTHSKIGIDVNANMFESLVDKVSSSHAHDQKLMQPRCGIAGWNYNGTNLGKSSNIGVFPCHRFINSFNCAQSGQTRTFGLIHNGESAGLGIPITRMENQQRRPRYDSSYRSHMPKHHRAELAKKASEYPSSEPASASNSNCPQMESVKPSRETLSLSDAHTDCIATDLSSMSTKMYRICQSKETNTMAQKHCEDRVSSAVDSVNIDQDITITCVESCDKPKVDCCNSSVRTAKTCQGAKVKQFTVNMRSKGASITGSCGASQNAAAGEREPADTTGSCCSSQNSKAGDPALVKSDSNIHVLFIRKNLKRGRASASKQRRRKQQKARATASCCPDNKAPPGGKLLVECSVDIGGDSTQDDKCGKSLSFYLGVSPSSDSHSVPNGRSLCSDFVVSFSDDDDDDDYDSVDGDWGDVEAELTQCNLFNYLPSAQSPFNFEVRISPVSSSENLQNKVLEDINSSWDVQISVKDRKQSSKKSGKKVHFPEDEHLSVVHPMVVWSYAYKSARKGHWENFVRDRNRFQRRIQDLEDTLVPVLNSEHRQQVLERRQDRIALTSGTPH